MLKIVIVVIIADGGLFLVDPQFGALGGFALIMALFISTLFSSTKKT